jgi:hypothetical protein
LAAIGVLCYFYLDSQGITCFPTKYPKAEVTLLRLGQRPTLWCYNVQFFYVFSVTPDFIETFARVAVIVYNFSDYVLGMDNIK